MAINNCPNDEKSSSNFWFTENLTSDLLTSAALSRITFEAKSEFQHMQIIETIPFGKTLVLDGKTQSALIDEHVYHETLVHPALLLHPNPKSVYIGGGGEFATAREVLRHKSIEKVVMVDIDKIVCDMCRKEMPEWNNGAYEDPRLEVHHLCAYSYLKNTNETFDIIIMDIADPIETGPGYILYTKEFYDFAKSKLNKNGIIVTQSGPAALYNWDECFSAIHKTLNTAFNVVIPFTVDIPSFGCNWGFNIATNIDNPNNIENYINNFVEMKSNDFNQLLRNRLTPIHISPEIENENKNDKETVLLKFLDGISHRGIFGVPKSIRDGIKDEKRIITIENPIYMY